MAIKPGKCPQGRCPEPTEKDCIEVFKVYDMCVQEDEVSGCINVTQIGCLDPLPPGATVRCTVVPDSAQCLVLGFGPFNPPFFRNVILLQTVDVKVEVLVDTTVICSGTITLDNIKQVFMWAPPGTFVQCQVLSVGNCSCHIIPGNPLQQIPTRICCSVPVCKEVQIKALVKLLVPSYGFCEKVPCVPGRDGFECPPDRNFPPQLCQDPPVIRLLNADGTGIAGVTVRLTRRVDGTVTITRVTGANGEADFGDIGGFAGSLDDIEFTDPLTLKTVTFHVPLEFTDENGVLRDSQTACDIQFRRTASGSRIFEVTIDGFKLQDTVDP